jgi:hypothetical protein
MINILTPLLGLLSALAFTLAAAEPAPWFTWRSKADGALVCSQTALGPGWEKSSGPYKDSHCEKPNVVK